MTWKYSLVSICHLHAWAVTHRQFIEWLFNTQPSPSYCVWPCHLIPCHGYDWNDMYKVMVLSPWTGGGGVLRKEMTETLSTIRDSNANITTCGSHLRVSETFLRETQNTWSRTHIHTSWSHVHTKHTLKRTVHNTLSTHVLIRYLTSLFKDIAILQKMCFPFWIAVFKCQIYKYFLNDIKAGK